MHISLPSRSLAVIGSTLAAAVLVAGSLAAPPEASAASRTTRTPVDPVYTVSLTGNADGRSWAGTESVTFRNDATVSLSTIWLRLWSNGAAGCAQQAISISAVTGGTAGALTTNCTAVPIRLNHRLAPQATATIAMNVQIEVPLRQDRFGYYQGVSMLGTALPTLAIHDANGWNLDPYADFGESYYSVVGDYNVALTVPSALKTATTGQVASDEDNGDGTDTRTISAKNVRDFEWAAAAFKKLTAVDGDGTTINVWYLPKHVTNADATSSLQTALDSMNTFSASFGKYPYPEVDIVLSQIGYGMEYPQIVFTIPGWDFVSHELAHQWWYGIVGNDQYSSPWLDESFASWSETLPYHVYSCSGPKPWPVASTRITRSMSYWSQHTSNYWVIYQQGACALADAASHLGTKHFIATLRTYAHDHWFGVTTTADFKAAIRKAAAKWAPHWNVNAYWKKWRIGAG